MFKFVLKYGEQNINQFMICVQIKVNVGYFIRVFQLLTPWLQIPPQVKISRCIVGI